MIYEEFKKRFTDFKQNNSIIPDPPWYGGTNWINISVGTKRKDIAKFAISGYDKESLSIVDS